MATLRDVARLAGVSPMTVSNVFTGRGGVRASTRDRVLAAATQLGYEPHLLARGLRTGRTSMVAFLSYDLVNPRLATTVKALEFGMADHGFHLLISNTDDNPVREASALREFIRQRVAGIVAISTGECSDLYQDFLSHGGALVAIERRLPGVSCDYVGTDRWHGTYQAVRYLVALGHRRIAIVIAPLHQWHREIMVDAWSRALEDGGIYPDPSLIGSGDNDVSSALRVVGTILDDVRPSAIFAANWIYTVATSTLLASRGLRMPEDIAFIGTGDSEWATLIAPNLSLVEIPGGKIGEAAADMLVQRLRGNAEAPFREMVFQPQLRLGTTSGRLPTSLL